MDPASLQSRRNVPRIELRAVCVYCGSNAGDNGEYLAAAATLGRLLADRGIELIYGGGRVGLMGRLADAAVEAGGTVTGVIPEALLRREVGHDRVNDLHVVGSMHERKAIMAERADAFLAMPGGLGTLEELFEILTWAQLGEHDKPCGLLNVAGYFDYLIAFLDHAVERGFLKPAHRQLLRIESQVDALLDRLHEPARSPDEEKWITRAEQT